MEQELETIERKFPLFTNGNRSIRAIRHNIFTDICTHLQAYMLGFIASDGCVNERRHALIFQISNKDEKILDIFKIISPNAKISYRKSASNLKGIRSLQKSIEDHGSVRFVIHSKILYDSLVQLGITEKKTYKELHIPKQIPDEYISSFILGYLDGDGYITTSLSSTKNNRLICKAGICSKTNSLLLEFQKILLEKEIKANIRFDKRDKMYYLDIVAYKSLQNFYNYIYSNNLGLIRKKIKLDEFLHDEKNLKQRYLNRKNQSITKL